MIIAKCRYFIPKPTFDFEISEGLYQCKITLPPNAAFQTTVGPLSSNTHLSKQLVCLEACKKLHEVGALDDHLLPLIEEPLENDLITKSKESSAGAGMCMHEPNFLAFKRILSPTTYSFVLL